MAAESRRHTLGPLNPRVDITGFLHDLFDDFLPPDAHIRATGRVHISMTRIMRHDNVQRDDPDEFFQGKRQEGKSYIVSHFRSRDELIQVQKLSVCLSRTRS